MKHTIFAITAIACLLFTLNTKAQDAKTEKSGKKSSKALVISNNGISLTKTDSSSMAKAEDKKWSVFSNFDIGINFLQDNTNYSDPGVQNYIKRGTPGRPGYLLGLPNGNLFSLRQGKSINVNIYPYLQSFRALKTRGQRIYVTSGIGFQIYNFRYKNNITYTKDPSTIITDSVQFTKNKVAIDYLNIPLMFTFKTRLHANEKNHKKDTWLIYGVGVTEGYAISAWTKQKSDARGKVKVHDEFNFSNFNTCLTAEIGIENIVKFYGSYQVTSLYNNGIDQHPISIGLRFGGI